jgi:hypothetical protein
MTTPRGKKKSCLARNRVGVDNKHQVSPDDFGMPHVVAIGRANSLKEGGINESAWVWRKKIACARAVLFRSELGIRHRDESLPKAFPREEDDVCVAQSLELDNESRQMLEGSFRLHEAVRGDIHELQHVLLVALCGDLLQGVHIATETVQHLKCNARKKPGVEGGWIETCSALHALVERLMGGYPGDHATMLRIDQAIPKPKQGDATKSLATP